MALHGSGCSRAVVARPGSCLRTCSLRPVSPFSAYNVLFHQRMSASSYVFDAVYVINLMRRPDRWAFIVQQLEKAGFRTEEYKRFSAVDGRGVDCNAACIHGLLSRLGCMRLREPESRRVWGMDLSPGAVGCALSHSLLWAEIAAKRYRCALVVEDDSLFPCDFHKKYLERMRQVPDNWELVYLSGLDTARQAPLLHVSEGVSRVPQMHRTTNCYVVSHRGARRLLDSCFPVTYQLDTMMTLNVVHEVQYSGVPRVAVPECYTLQPPLVVQATRMGSDIQDKSGKSCEEELLEEKGRCKAAGWCDDNSEAL